MYLATYVPRDHARMHLTQYLVLLIQQAFEFDWYTRDIQPSTLLLFYVSMVPYVHISLHVYVSFLCNIAKWSRTVSFKLRKLKWLWRSCVHFTVVGTAHIPCVYMYILLSDSQYLQYKNHFGLHSIKCPVKFAPLHYPNWQHPVLLEFSPVQVGPEHHS